MSHKRQTAVLRLRPAIMLLSMVAELVGVLVKYNVLQARSFALNLSALQLDASKTPCGFLATYLF
ncbi:MAG: hypothetical protein WAN95_06610 [Bacteroidales bacterium]